MGLRRFQAAPHISFRYSCTNWTAIEPSPTAEATRLTEPERTSPAAKTPRRLVSSRNGWRFDVRAATRRARAGQHEAAFSSRLDLLRQPVGARNGADEAEERGGLERPLLPGRRCSRSRPRRARSSPCIAPHLRVAAAPRCSSVCSMRRDEVARHVLSGRRRGSGGRPCARDSARKTAACPAELPPPTTTTSAPRQSCASLGVAA